MKHKRFKHQVYIFCHMFLGWQLINDLEELEKISSGILEIDIKNGTCTCNGENNITLTMPLVLNDWFLRDLNENNIQISAIDKALLTVKFKLQNNEKKHILENDFECISFIYSGENKYILEYQGEEGENIVKIT